MNLYELKEAFPNLAYQSLDLSTILSIRLRRRLPVSDSSASKETSAKPRTRVKPTASLSADSLTPEMAQAILAKLTGGQA